MLTNSLPGLTGAYAGAAVSLSGLNLSTGFAVPVVTVGGQTAGILSSSATQVVFQIPVGLLPGAATLTFSNGFASAFPITVNIDTAPASITAIVNSAGASIDSNHPAHQGDLITMNVSGGMPDVAQVSIGGVLHNPLQITSLGPGSFQIAVLLNSSDPVGPAQQLIVYLDGRSSFPSTLAVARPDGTFTLADQSADNQPN